MWQKAGRGRAGARTADGAAEPALELDCVHDQLATGRRLRVLNIVDDVTRDWLGAAVDISISGKRVVGALADLIADRRRPGMIVSESGTEPTSNAVRSRWGKATVERHHIAPGMPMENGSVESLASPLFGSTAPCVTNCVTNCSTKRCCSASPPPAL